MQGIEKRLSKRTSFQKSVEIELSATSEIQAGASLVRWGRGIDISSTGMGLETDFAPEKGALLRVHVPLSEPNVKMPVLAQVQWVVADRQRHRAGLRFLA